MKSFVFLLGLKELVGQRNFSMRFRMVARQTCEQPFYRMQELRRVACSSTMVVQLNATPYSYTLLLLMINLSFISSSAARAPFLFLLVSFLGCSFFFASRLACLAACVASCENPPSTSLRFSRTQSRTRGRIWSRT